MAKKELLSKLNLKDYNNELEIILEKKDFSSQVKNLLLSMFYKLEIGYKDYNIVKRDVPSKEAFMESLMHIIKTRCQQIELIKPTQEVQEEKKYLIYPEEGRICCYPNEASLLHAILEIGIKEFFVSDAVLKRAVQKVLKEGYELDVKELLTNFDGWSWNNNLDKTDSIDCYLIYQNVRILMGNTFLYEWKRDRRKERDYLGEIKKVSVEFWVEFCKFCLLEAAQREEERKHIQDELKKLKEQQKKMEDKSNFLKEIYEQKRLVSERIKRMDQILNDNDLIREEFLSRNSELEESKKIFSISDLEELLQKERNENMEILQEYNAILEPKNYLEKMKKLEEKIELMASVKLDKVTKQTLEEEQMKIQDIFLETFKKKLANAVTKKEMIELIYQYRYYLYLPIRKEGKTVLIKEIQELKKELEEIAKKMITKACKLKVLLIINQDIAYNFQMMMKILDTKIIHLEDIYVSFSETEEEIHMEVYDSEVLDRTETVPKEKIKDFMIKFNKKIKLFA